MYAEAFDLQKYAQLRNKYIGQVVLIRKKTLPLFKEIYNLMREKKVPVPLGAYLYFYYYSARKMLAKLPYVQSIKRR